MIEIGLSILALVAMLAAFAARDEDGLREVWRGILSPTHRRRYDLLARQGAEHERAIASTRAAAVDALRAGDAATAARLTQAAVLYETQTLDERRRSSLLRRMLSAIE